MNPAILGGLFAADRSKVELPADVVAAVHNGVSFVHRKAPNDSRLSK